VTEFWHPCRRRPRAWCGRARTAGWVEHCPRWAADMHAGRRLRLDAAAGEVSCCAGGDEGRRRPDRGAAVLPVWGHVEAAGGGVQLGSATISSSRVEPNMSHIVSLTSRMVPDMSAMPMPMTASANTASKFVAVDQRREVPATGDCASEDRGLVGGDELGLAISPVWHHLTPSQVTALIRQVRRAAPGGVRRPRAVSHAAGLYQIAGPGKRGRTTVSYLASSASNARTRWSMSSRMGRIWSRVLPAGSVRSQSR
jgi:hypothetical protein